MFELVPKTLILESKKEEVILEFSQSCQEQPGNDSIDFQVDANNTPPRKGDKQQSSYETLPEEEKDQLRALVYILEKFGISVEAYRELSLSPSGESLPKTYIVEECKKDLVEELDIQRTPGPNVGAELDLILSLQMDEQVTTAAASPIKIKISADGTALKRCGSLLVVTYAILDDSMNMMSSEGNRVVAVVRAGESYDILKTSLANIRKSVDTIVSTNTLKIKDQDIPVEAYLGGDYKFLLNVLGLKAATSKFACIYCDIDSDSRQHLEKAGNTRTLSGSKISGPGVIADALFEITPENIVIDELHLIMRVMDRLEEGIIYELIGWDETEDVNIGEHIQLLLNCASECGVKLNVWTCKDTNKLKWTSMTGDQKKRLLKFLPEKFDNILPPTSVESTKHLWKELHELYLIINTDRLTDADIVNFEQKVLAWAKCLLNMQGAGYTWNHPITPYIHIFAKHVPDMLRRYRSLRRFTGQGVEKKNDVVKQAFYKSNKMDPCADILKSDCRMRATSSHRRAKRSYNKKNMNYWDIEKAKRAQLKMKENRPPVSTSLFSHDAKSLSTMKLSQLNKLYLKKFKATPPKGFKKANLIESLSS